MGMESTPGRRKRHDDFLRRQEKRWAKKAGQVTVRQATPEELAALEAKSAARRGLRAR